MRGGVQLKRASTDFASYRIGESARIAVQIRNTAAEAASAEIRPFAKPPGEGQFYLVDQRRRIPDGESESEWITSVRLRAGPGLWTLRVELCQDPVLAADLAIEGHPVPIDRMTSAL
jgi:hypothetical protein